MNWIFSNLVPQVPTLAVLVFIVFRLVKLEYKVDLGFEKADRKLEKEISTLRREMQALEYKVDVGFQRVDYGFQMIRKEMDQGFKDIRSEMDQGFKDVRNEMKEGFMKHEYRFEKNETRIGNLEQAHQTEAE